MENKVNSMPLDASVDTCPACGYTDGFHVSFKVDGDTVAVILICPQCHTRFHPGWEVMKHQQDC